MCISKLYIKSGVLFSARPPELFQTISPFAITSRLYWNVHRNDSQTKQIGFPTYAGWNLMNLLDASVQERTGRDSQNIYLTYYMICCVMLKNPIFMTIYQQKEHYPTAWRYEFFIFSWWKKYFPHSLHLFVKYFHHSKILKSIISSHRRVIPLYTFRTFINIISVINDLNCQLRYVANKACTIITYD